MSDEKRAGDVIKAKKRELEKAVGEAVLQFCISTGLRISNIDVDTCQPCYGSIRDICTNARIEV